MADGWITARCSEQMRAVARAVVSEHTLDLPGHPGVIVDAEIVTETPLLPSPVSGDAMA